MWRTTRRNRKNFSLGSYCAGPVVATSLIVLTPPIPQWDPSVARGGAPRLPRHPLEFHFSANYFESEEC